jgi:hypothetical protein
MYLNKTYIKIRKDESLSDTFPVQNGLKQTAALLLKNEPVTKKVR